METARHRHPWEHAGVRIEGGRLVVAGRDAEALAREHGTPLYVFDVTRVAEQARALRDALALAGLTPRVRLALKAQRAPEVLAALRALGAPGSPDAVGIDACSPGEVLHALEHGFTAEEISFTATNVSERDLDVIGPAGVHVNLDLLSQIERFGRCCPGRAIGLRVIPRRGVMRGHTVSLYSGTRPTKFGIYEEDWMPRSLRPGVAGSRSTRCTSTSPTARSTRSWPRSTPPSSRSRAWPTGCSTPAVRSPRSTPAAASARRSTPARSRSTSTPTPPSWRGASLTSASPCAEPGEFLTNESGVMLAEVVTVEDRLGTTFVGLDAGWNVLSDRYICGREPVALVAARADAPRDRVVTLAGHINEGDDLLAAGHPFPAVQEGEIVAFVSVGGYSPGMWTDHCLRPRAGTLYLDRRL